MDYQGIILNHFSHSTKQSGVAGVSLIPCLQDRLGSLNSVNLTPRCSVLKKHHQGNTVDHCTDQTTSLRLFTKTTLGDRCN